MMPRHAVVGLLVILAALAGCARPQMDTGDDKTLPVDVSRPVKKDVQDFLDFTGRLDSPNAVEIRARVTGYIMETPFKEGDVVDKDALLFLIDKRPYQAKYDDGKAQLELQKARLKLARADNLRAKEIAKTPGAISKQELDKYEAAEEEARAAVNAADASLETYRLNLTWCEVRSPIAGRVSRFYFTRGNLITQDSSVLTSVVSEDPMYAYFDVDERAVLRVKRDIASGRIRPHPRGEFPIAMALADENLAAQPHKGFVNFINNRLDPLTGTITIRGEFVNPLTNVKNKDNRRLFTPGMFVRVRVPLGDPHPAVLVAERALVTDQGLKNVFILDKDDKVRYRRVDLGALQPDGLRVIDSGLDGSERVLTSHLQLVRPGMRVDPQLKAMPTTSPAAPRPAPTLRGK